MSVGPISFGGLASGLDTNAIIGALLQAEAIPIAGLESQKSLAQNKIDLLGSLDGLLGTLKDKAKALSTPDDFLAHAVTPSEEGVASISVTGAPTAGSHSLKVETLAAASKFAFDGLADKSVALTGTSLSFDYDGTTYDIDTTGKTLDQVAADINSSTGGEVEASVVNTGTENSPSYQLVLSGSQTGADFAIQNLTTDSAELGLADELVVASNAKIELDGLVIERSTNTFDDVLEGISIDVQSLSDDSPGGQISFTVDVDKDSIKDKLKELVDAYNGVIEFINGQQEFTPAAGDDDDAETGGALFGDPVLTTVKQSINDALFGVDSDKLAEIQNDTTGFSMAGLVGLDLQLDGTIEIDDTELDEKLNENLDAFMDLFADTDGFDNGGVEKSDPNYYVDSGTTDSGIADLLTRKIDELLDDKVSATGKTLPGLIQGRIDALNDNIDLYDDRIDDLNDRLEDLELTLTKKFTALEELMAGLNSQGQFLAAQLTQLNG